jgi:hypothetical protein
MKVKFLLFSLGLWNVCSISVKGNAFIDSSGNLIKLRGVSHSGTEYGCVQKNPDGSQKPIIEGNMNQAAIEAIKSWGQNVVRIPLNEDCWLGINGAAYNATIYQNTIKDFVDRIIATQGMHVILDLHWTADGSTLATQQDPMPDLSHSTEFWGQVASKFKYNQNIIFELFNEPFPGKGNAQQSDWQCWQSGACDESSGVTFKAAGMKQLTKTVRNAGAKNVIMLGGLTWANHLDGWLDFVPSDPLKNLAAVWHSYDFNACNSLTCWDSTIAPILAKYPVVVTETGFKIDFCKNLWAWLENNGASYLVWTWNTWGAQQGLVSDYQTGSPTSPYGETWKAWLKANPAPTPVAPTPVAPTPPPGPAPSGCPGGSLSACIDLCPSNPPAAYTACIQECTGRCN